MTWNELYHWGKGVRLQTARQEGWIRNLAYLIAAANRNPKKPMPSIGNFWPIPELDLAAQVGKSEDLSQIRARLMKLWQISEN
jgi:hypothetical protein